MRRLARWGAFRRRIRRFLRLARGLAALPELFQNTAEGVNARPALHGAVALIVAHIQESAHAGPVRVSGVTSVNNLFAQKTLLPRLINVLEQAVEQASDSIAPAATPHEVHTRRA